MNSINMSKEEVIEELKSLKADMNSLLRYGEPENLPHRPFRMTILEKDVDLLIGAIHYLSMDK